MYRLSDINNISSKRVRPLNLVLFEMWAVKGIAIKMKITYNDLLVAFISIVIFVLGLSSLETSLFHFEPPNFSVLYETLPSKLSFKKSFRSLTSMRLFLCLWNHQWRLGDSAKRADNWNCFGINSLAIFFFFFSDTHIKNNNK